VPRIRAEFIAFDALADGGLYDIGFERETGLVALARPKPVE
jgi:hypothetical protein